MSWVPIYVQTIMVAVAVMAMLLAASAAEVLACLAVAFVALVIVRLVSLLRESLKAGQSSYSRAWHRVARV